MISGTPTTVGSSTFTVKVTNTEGTATRQLLLAVVDAAADWPQSDHDAGARNWNPADDAINPTNVASIVETYSIASGSSWAPAIAGPTAYIAGEVPARDGTYAVMAIDLVSGGLDWFGPSLPGACNGGPVAVTATAVVVNCGSLVAYALAAPHDLLWTTADTDPGVSTQNLRVSGTSAVVWASDRVLAYRLSDGQRLWQQLLPAGATGLTEVAVEGNTVVVGYNDRVRTLNLVTGAQLWTKSLVRAGNGFGGLVVADGWIYLNNEGGAQRYALADGALGWSTQAGVGIYQVLGVDADTAYMWLAAFDFGPPSPSIILALNTADGSERWRADIPSRVRSFAVSQRLVWVTSTEIYSQGRSSDLLALDRGTGTPLKSVHFDDNIYGFAAFGNGHVLLTQGGSFGNNTPARLRVFSLAAPLPVITTRAVPTGRVGTAYSASMEAAGGTGPLNWAVTSGSLPAGLSMSSAGALTGTPTLATFARVTVRVVDADGRAQSRQLHVEVLGAGNADWTAEGRNGSRNGWNRGEVGIGLDTALGLAYRWKTSTTTTEVYGANDRQPVVVGDRLFDVDLLGRLNAWSTTGSTANRLPLWTKSAVGAQPDGCVNHYPDSPVASGGVLYLMDAQGFLEAVQLSTGAQLWRREVGPQSRIAADLLVVGNLVLKLDAEFDLRAYNTSDGTDAWGGLEVLLDGNELYGSPVIATDGTRAFVLAQCEVHAIDLASGARAWNVPVSLGSVGAQCPGVPSQAFPMVSDGVVFATTYDGSIAIQGATGTVRWRSGTRGGYGDGAGVIANGVWILSNGYYDDGNIVALDAATGEVLWRNATVPGAMHYSAAGDLLVGRSYYSLKGYSLIDGQEVWDGGTPETTTRQQGAATISGGRIFINTFEGVKAYGAL